MRKKRKRYRTKRKPFPWQPFLWLLIFGVAWLGVTRSPMTALRTVRVVGASEQDQPQILAFLDRYKRVPVLQINPDEVVNEIERLGDVESAEISRNIFGRAVVKVALRQPTATIEGTTYGLDASGVPFNLEGSKFSNLPQVRIADAALKPHAAFLEPCDFASLAKAVKLLQIAWPNSGGILTQSADGALCLNRGEKGLVNFGGSGDLEDKFAKLQSILAQSPNPLDHPGILSLVSPTHPAMKPFEKGKEQP